MRNGWKTGEFAGKFKRCENFLKEGKMKKWLLLAVSFTVFAAAGISFITAYFGSRDCGSAPFPKPENLAQKIANFVILNDKNPIPRTFVNKDGSQSSGRTFHLQFYDAYFIYRVEVDIQNDGQKKLEISRYFTNKNFDFLKIPADLAAEVIISGKLGMYEIIHIYDDAADMKVELFQMFSKLRNGCFYNFSREDLNNRKELGIDEFIYDDGMMCKNGGEWVKASEEDIKEIQNIYGDLLSGIAKYLKMK
jgi:hypothetical protein